MTPDTFIEHFATFAAAPNGVAKLRELILQLAVQGQLVPQDENDEPITSLLAVIDREWVKNGKTINVSESRIAYAEAPY